MDAGHTNQVTADKIVDERGADYLIQVKGNTSNLLEFIERKINNCSDVYKSTSSNCGHGRYETRTIEMVSTTPIEANWAHAHTVCRVTRTRDQYRQGEVIKKSKPTISYYVASFNTHSHSPKHVLQMIRGHWYVENGLHHRKDRSMDEDRNRGASTGSGRMMCALRSIAAGILGMAKESMSVLWRRFTAKPGKLIELFGCTSHDRWLKRSQPYILK